LRARKISRISSKIARSLISQTGFTDRYRQVAGEDLNVLHQQLVHHVRELLANLNDEQVQQLSPDIGESWAVKLADIIYRLYEVSPEGRISWCDDLDAELLYEALVQSASSRASAPEYKGTARFRKTLTSPIVPPLRRDQFDVFLRRLSTGDLNNLLRIPGHAGILDRVSLLPLKASGPTKGTVCKVKLTFKPRAEDSPPLPARLGDLPHWDNGRVVVWLTTSRAEEVEGPPRIIFWTALTSPPAPRDPHDRPPFSEERGEEDQGLPEEEEDSPSQHS
jgi:hypothetical protein